MKSRLLNQVLWAVTALGSIHVGLRAMGMDVVMQHLGEFGKMVEYGVGVAGVVSLVFFMMSCCGSSCE